MQTDRQAGKETGRQTDKETDRQTTTKFAQNIFRSSSVAIVEHFGRLIAAQLKAIMMATDQVWL